MDGRENKDTNSNLGDEATNNPGAIFTPQEQLIEVEETTPTINMPEQVRPISVRSNTTVASGTGDVKLPREKKSSKPRIIIVLVVVFVIALIIVCTISLAILFNTPNREAIESAFSDYKAYVMDGPSAHNEDRQDTDANADEWYIFRINDSGLTTTEIKTYISDVTSKFDAFRSLLDKSNMTTRIEDLDGLKANISEYGALLIALTRIPFVKEDLWNAYMTNGAEFATVLIQDTINLEPATGLLERLLESIEQYLHAELEVLQVYTAHGCIKDTSVDADCVDTLRQSNAAYQTILRQQQLYDFNINSTLVSLQQNFMYDTGRIEAWLDMEEQ